MFKFIFTCASINGVEFAIFRANIDAAVIERYHRRGNDFAAGGKVPEPGTRQRIESVQVTVVGADVNLGTVSGKYGG